MTTPNRWTELSYDAATMCFVVRLWVANPLPDGPFHYPSQLQDMAIAHTMAQAEAMGAAMLKAEKGAAR